MTERPRLPPLGQEYLGPGHNTRKVRGGGVAKFCPHATPTSYKGHREFSTSLLDMQEPRLRITADGYDETLAEEKFQR